MDASQNEGNLVARKSIYHSARNMATGPMPMLPNWQYYLNMPDEDPHIFNMSSLFEVYKTLDCQILAEATDALLNHHDSLRVRLFRMRALISLPGEKVERDGERHGQDAGREADALENKSRVHGCLF